MSNDVKIVCQDCGREFIFKEEEQKFYEDKGFMPPKRCRHCRQVRKNRNKGGKNYGKKENN